MTDVVTYHRGISIFHIPVEGAAGFLFVLATGFIFGVGIPAIREILAVTLPSWGFSDREFFFIGTSGIC